MRNTGQEPLLARVKLADLRPHERTDAKKVGRLARELRSQGQRKPLLVDARSLAILDGHHRVEALRQNGVLEAQALLVN